MSRAAQVRNSICVAESKVSSVIGSVHYYHSDAAIGIQESRCLKPAVFHRAADTNSAWPDEFAEVAEIVKGAFINNGI